MVYFMQRGARGPIKIGESIQPERRRRQVQREFEEYVALSAIMPGDIRRTVSARACPRPQESK